MGGYLQNLFQSLDVTSILDALKRVFAVLLCLSVHETCHGLAALALGDPTAKEHSRLSLNPLRHIDWLGLVMMFTAGFGWAKPVPVDPRYFRNPKRGMALTALAGPLSNFLLAALAVFLILPTYHLAMGLALAGGPDIGWLMILLRDIALLSLGLGVFNLIPIPPLDGSKVLAALLPNRVYFTWLRFERYGMLLLLVIVLLGWQGNFVTSAVVWLYTRLTRLFLGSILG